MRNSDTLMVPHLPPGFIWIYRFDAEGRPQSVASTIPPELDAIETGFYWLHINIADMRVRGWLEDAPLPAAVKAGLVSMTDHQHVETADDFIWGCFVDQTREVHGGSDGVDFFRFALCDRFLLSARRQPLNCADATRGTLDSGKRMIGTAHLFETIAGHAVGAFARRVTELSKGLEAIEDRVLDDELHDERQRLGPLRRDAVRLHRQLTGLQSIFARLEETSAEEAKDDVRESATRLSQRVEALHLEIYSAQERARLLKDEISDKIAGETNRHLFVLTVLTTLVLPPTVVAGIFGMNTKNLFFSESDNGTIYAMLLCMLASAAAYWIMRRWGVLR